MIPNAFTFDIRDTADADGSLLLDLQLLETETLLIPNVDGKSAEIVVSVNNSPQA